MILSRAQALARHPAVRAALARPRFTPGDIDEIKRVTYLIPRGQSKAGLANSARLRRIYADPDQKAALIKKQRAAGRAVWSALMKSWWADPEKRAALLELRRKDLPAWRRAELRAIISRRPPLTRAESARLSYQKRRNRRNANRARWQHPVHRVTLLTQLAAAREKEFARRRAKREGVAV